MYYMHLLFISYVFHFVMTWYTGYVLPHHGLPFQLINAVNRSGIEKRKLFHALRLCCCRSPNPLKDKLARSLVDETLSNPKNLLRGSRYNFLCKCGIPSDLNNAQTTNTAAARRASTPAAL